MFASFGLRKLYTLSRKELPDYETRRVLLARDPLACVYAFYVLVGLAFRHIFGLKFCPKCPDCACSNNPCMDAFGSSTTARGGVFGRIDAVYASLECQRCGTYHLHGQFFLECFHQFRSLKDLVEMGQEPLLELLRKYSDYSAHVRRMIYEHPEEWEDKREEIEAQWPEYKQSTLMPSRPQYQRDPHKAAADWRLAYFSDVEVLQMHKQHHVHIADSKGIRQPLHHCKDPKDPTKCKAHFPRTEWLTEKPILICPSLAKEKDMPHKGKRSMVGLPWGPCNDPNLNGNHPALLSALRCNGDVQLPFRFPITEDTHNHKLCREKCHEQMTLEQLVRDAQITQAAQAGYACDYQNKRAQIANQETKEMMKGQQHLYEDLKDNKAGYYGARTVKRLITDCYGRGIVRGAVETTNLNIMSEHADPTAAETVKTAQVTEISLHHPLKLLDHIAAEKPWPKESCKAIVDKRNPIRRKLTECPPWTAYGDRGNRPEVHGLSAYEFARHFQMKQAKYPFSLKKHSQCPEKYHAELTGKGIEKLEENATAGKKLLAGTDYVIKEAGGEDWLPLGDGKLVQAYRHDWIITRRLRPHVPVIFGAQSGRTKAGQAARLLVLFFPWVNNIEDASPNVPFINELVGPKADYTEVLLRHAERVGFPTETAKHQVLNFVFAFCLPRQLRPTDGLEENSGNEDMEDELLDFHLEGDDLLAATRTHVRGNGLKPVEDEDSCDSPAEEVQEAAPAPTTRPYDMTMHMFGLSSAIWQGPRSGTDEAAYQRHEEMLRSAGAADIDRVLALQAAKASRNSEKKAKKSAGLVANVLEPELEAGRRKLFCNMLQARICFPVRPAEQSDDIKYYKAWSI